MKLKKNTHQTALYLAVYSGYYEMVKLLLTCKTIDINQINVI